MTQPAEDPRDAQIVSLTAERDAARADSIADKAAAAALIATMVAERDAALTAKAAVETRIAHLEAHFTSLAAQDQSKLLPKAADSATVAALKKNLIRSARLEAERVQLEAQLKLEAAQALEAKVNP